MTENIGSELEILKFFSAILNSASNLNSVVYTFCNLVASNRRINQRQLFCFLSVSRCNIKNR